MKTFGMLLLVAGGASFAFAGTPLVPEIDGSTAVSAVALAGGIVMILRGRLKK